MDEIDRAQERTEQFMNHSLGKLAATPALPAPTGACFNCQASVSDGERYCDSDCRDDWQHRQKYKQG